MEKYLIAMQPLTSPSEMERLKQLVKKFSTGPGAIGPRLQLYLEQQREQKDNWAYEYWLNDMYLSIPSPLPVHSNPGMIFPPRKFTKMNDMARFAARMLDGILDHKETLDAKALPQEKATSREKGQPLCMAQYYRLLTSYRMPGKVRDSILSFVDQQQDHVIVACRNQFYCVSIKAQDRRVTELELYSQFVEILNDTAPPPPKIGLLTTENRQKWAELRETLIKIDLKNKQNLELIEKSLVLICFDFDKNQMDRTETNQMYQMIHGDGSSLNSANRWFDKTVQIIVSNDGVCGLCYEHSPSEGIAVVQLMENLIKRCEDLNELQPISGIVPPERLEWVLDSRQLQAIQEASVTLDSLINDFNLEVYRFRTYGKTFIKSCKVSPDAWIQLALQLTYFTIYGHLVHTYESASTRRFRLGRVDCIRSATQETLNWCTAMCSQNSSEFDLTTDPDVLAKKKEEKIELLNKAVKRQTEIMIENIMGEGIDIHLLGLREAARETTPTAASPLPDLFLDEIYLNSNLFLLSTSQISTTTDSVMGYGPVVPDGYGASYNPHPDSIVFCLSSFNTSDQTSTSKFSQNLEESLIAMQELLKP